MIFVTVFGTTFQINFHPSGVFYLAYKLSQRYGTNLDTRAPMWARFAVRKAARRYGVAQTPI